MKRLHSTVSTFGLLLLLIISSTPTQAGIFRHCAVALSNVFPFFSSAKRESVPPLSLPLSSDRSRVRNTPVYEAPEEESFPKKATEKGDLLPDLLGVKEEMRLNFLGRGGFSLASIVKTPNNQNVLFSGGIQKSLNGLVVKLPHGESAGSMEESRLNAVQKRDEKAFEALRLELEEDAASQAPKYEGIEVAATRFVWGTDGKLVAVLQEATNGFLLDDLLRARLDFYRDLLFAQKNVNYGDHLKTLQRRTLVWLGLMIRLIGNPKSAYTFLSQYPTPPEFQFKPGINLQEVMEMFLEESIEVPVHDANGIRLEWVPVERIITLLLRLKTLDEKSLRLEDVAQYLVHAGLGMTTLLPWIEPWHERTPIRSLDARLANYKFYIDPKTNKLNLKIFDL